MAIYPKEKKEEVKAFKAKMAILKTKLPFNYTQMIMDRRLGTTGIAERKRVSRVLIDIAWAGSYSQSLRHPEYVVLLEELADKYEFFMKIYN